MASSNTWQDSKDWRRGDTPSSLTPDTKSELRYQPRQTYSKVPKEYAQRIWRKEGQDEGTNPHHETNAPPRAHTKRPQRLNLEPRTRPDDRQRTAPDPVVRSPKRGTDGTDGHHDRDSSDNDAAAAAAAADDAISEGRRIYLGNLRYQAKPEDVEALLRAAGLGAHFTRIHISIDPFTGRNPSYCFAEFGDRGAAARAMATLEGRVLLGREVRCRPCRPREEGAKGNRGLNRWGHWTGEKKEDGGKAGEGEDEDAQPQPQPQPQHQPAAFGRYRQDMSGKRLYVGGLPRMHDQATNFEEMSEFFKGFQVEAISKRVSAHAKKKTEPGHHDFCFVDLATPQEAYDAMKVLNGRTFRGLRLKVSIASEGQSRKWKERDALVNEFGLARKTDVDQRQAGEALDSVDG
ncbi:RNA-binding domain-containing protein [Xylariaceae sp. FL0016]|nr:RNA-binding domain-containing protein [Xylariaceae sp. FL0016]